VNTDFEACAELPNPVSRGVFRVRGNMKQQKKNRQQARHAVC